MEQEQRWGDSHGPPESNNECPFCNTPLSEADYERASDRFQKTTGESAKSGSAVKYQRTMRSVRNAHGTEIMSVKEQYEQFENSILVRAAVALNGYLATAAARSRAVASATRQKYARGAARLKQGVKKLASKVSRWFDKWVFFVFKRTEEGLSKVSG